MGLVAAAIIPVWLFAAYVLISFALAQRDSYRDQAEGLARQSASVVDGALRDMLVRIDGLARSEAFATGDLQAAHADAKRLVAGTQQAISLRDLGQRQYFNTQFEFGQPLAQAAELSDEELEAAGNSHAISNVYADPATGQYKASVVRPIELPDASTALIEISAPVEHFHSILVPSVPVGWVVGVGDRAGVYVTRSSRHEELAGKAGAQEYIAKAIGRSGNFTSLNLFGEKLLAGYYRSDFSGWLYGANIPLSTVEAPLWQSLSWIGAIGLIALAASLSLAYFLGMMMTRETRLLAKQARQLGAGEPVAQLGTRFSEFEVISEAFVEAATMIRERTSELEAVLDTVPVGVWFTYDPSGRQVVRNRQAAALMGLQVEPNKRFGTPEEVIDTVAFKDGEIVARDDRPLTKAMRGEETSNEEYLYRLPDGTELTLLSSAKPIANTMGTVVGAVQVSLDVSERKRAEVQRKLLTKELDHRVKNNLAIVQALVQQTLRNSVSLEEAQAGIVARLAALARAHDILTQSAWLQGDLRATVEATVSTQATLDRIGMDGPSVSLSPSQVMAISLAVHELTTNALKYGALSNDTGKVSISWTVEEDGGALKLIWAEAGGPTVIQPTKRGFGSRLLERMTASEGGSTSRTFSPSGLYCEIRIPLRNSEPASLRTR